MTSEAKEQRLREFLLEGQNFYDQTPFTGIIRDLPDELAQISPETIRHSISKIARDLKNPIWESLADIRTTSAMLEMRQAMIAKGIRTSVSRFGIHIPLPQAIGVEVYLEQSLGEYPLIYDYINEEVGGNRPFLSNGERSRKLVINVPIQPTYFGWLNHQNYFKAQEPVGEKV